MERGFYHSPGVGVNHLVGALPQRFQYLAGMARDRRITVRVPNDLLERAVSATGAGTRETVIAALGLLVAAEACRTLRALRGKVRFSLDLEALRDDRPVS